jgi:anti-sigma factor RsiW
VTELPDFTDLDLHAFVDGELPAERHAAIAAMIGQDPALQRQVDEIRELNMVLGRLADPLLTRPIPDRLVRAAHYPPDARRVSSLRRPHWKAGAVAMAMAASIAIGVFLVHDHGHHEAGPEAVADPVVAEALAARDGDLAPVRHVSFAPEGDAGARDRFVSEALGNSMHAPDLRHAGFTLAAADFYDGTGGRAVQLRYIDRDLHLFTVYIHPGAGPDRFSLVTHNMIRICVWQNEDMSTVMSAELPTSELFRLSSMTYSALAL